MKSQNRKKVFPLDSVKENQNQQFRQRNIKNKHKEDFGHSEESSDFSQFQLQSKDINNDARLFKKPKKSKKQNRDRISKLNSNNEQKNSQAPSKQKKIDNQKKNDNFYLEISAKDKIKNKQNLGHIISFKKSSSSSGLFEKQQKSKEQGLKDKNQSQDEQLIKEYDKTEFKNKNPQISTNPNRKTLSAERSKSNRKQVKQQDNEEPGMIQTSGGLCFDVNKEDFVHKLEATPKDSKRKKRKKVASVVDLNSRQQILKRRQAAFNYGKNIRLRNFGYY